MRFVWPALVAALFLLTTPGSAAPARQPAPQWHDPSPHRTRFIEVERGVRLEVLDWGGSGDAVALLAGHGDTAHIFDDFAPGLARRFHVIAITRRGFGASSQPAADYALPRLVDDIKDVMDALHIRRASLVGHSIAGEEMDAFAAAYPGRLNKQLYLDAAYDRVEDAQVEARLAFPRIPRPTAQDQSSPAAMRDYLARTEALFPEAEVRATRHFAPDGHYLSEVTPDSVARAVAKISVHPDYARLPACAMAIYAGPKQTADLFPFYPLLDQKNQKLLDADFQTYSAWQATQRDAFKRAAPKAIIVVIPRASHYVFLTDRDQVLSLASRYLGEPRCPVG